MPINQPLTPARGMPHFSSLVFPKIVPTPLVLSTAGGVRVLTPAELLGGLLLVDCQDAQTLTLPTAALLSAAIPGVAVGTSFDVNVVNYGDSLLTVGLGVGITKPAIAGVSPLLTIATLSSKQLKLVCLAVAQGTTADAWGVYAFGTIAAAVAL
jgi:hypothetical protein